MKRIISLMLTLAIFTSVIYPCQSVIAQEVKLNNILSIGRDVAEMCAEYDKYDNLDDTTVSNRLIVKQILLLMNMGLSTVFMVWLCFLQYTNNIAAKKALNYYKNSGYIVNYDSPVTCMDSADHNQWGDEWAYERVDSDSAIDYYKLKVKSNINIAVVDSGINYNHELFKNRIIRTKYNISTTGTKDDEIDDLGHGTEVSGVIANSTPSNTKYHRIKLLTIQVKVTIQKLFLHVVT